jgi:hypothetical protein
MARKKRVQLMKGVSCRTILGEAYWYGTSLAARPTSAKVNRAKRVLRDSLCIVSRKRASVLGRAISNSSHMLNCNLWNLMCQTMSEKFITQTLPKYAPLCSLDCQMTGPWRHKINVLTGQSSPHKGDMNPYLSSSTNKLGNSKLPLDHSISVRSCPGFLRLMRYFVSASFPVSCLICVIFAQIGYLQTQFN